MMFLGMTDDLCAEVEEEVGASTSPLSTLLPVVEAMYDYFGRQTYTNLIIFIFTTIQMACVDETHMHIPERSAFFVFRV
jgi:heme/copper-type cytochrome/quinol oxidase subunit 4